LYYIITAVCFQNKNVTYIIALLRACVQPNKRPERQDHYHTSYDVES
jgi:hypothetical protein